MTKQLLVFMIVIALNQSANSAAVAYDETESLKKVIQEILQVSEDLCESLQSAVASHRFFDKTKNFWFDDEVDEVIATLEETASRYDDQKVQDSLLRLAQGLHNIQETWRILQNNQDKHAQRRRIINLITRIIQNAKRFEAWKEIIDENPFNYTFYTDITPALIKVVKTLKTLQSFVKDHGYRPAPTDQPQQSSSASSCFSTILGVIRTKREAQTTEIVKYLRNIASEDYEIKRDLMLYIVNLIQTLVGVIDDVQDERVEQPVTNLKNVKKELQELYTSGVFYEVAEVKVALALAIERVAAEIENLQVTGSRSSQFVEYLNGVKHHVDNVVNKDPLEGYRSKLDVRKKPMGYVYRITNNPAILDN